MLWFLGVYKTGIKSFLNIKWHLQNQNLNEVSVLQSWIQFYLTYTWNFFNGSHICNITGMFLEQKGLEMVTIINCYGLRAFDGSCLLACILGSFS